MNNPLIIGFFIEWLKRYGQESPKFFKVLTTIGVVLQLITGIPQLLEWAHVKLPSTWDHIWEVVIFFVGLAITIVSGATVKNSTATIVQPVTGDKTIVVNEALPFTARTEEKKAKDDPTTNVTTSPAPLISSK